MSDAVAIKAEANKAFSAKDYSTASKLYSDAIALDSNNHVLYSNRSASKAALRDYDGALEDAEKCIEILPSFAKGHARKGAALHGKRQFPEAVMAYEEGLQADPSNDVLKRGLEEVKKAMENDENGPFQGADMGLGRMFQDPGLMRKLETHPKTKDAMLDPGFRAKIQRMQSGGGQMDLPGMMGDPRMLSVLGVAMGIDIDAMERTEGSSDMPPGMGGSSAQESQEFKPEPAAPRKPQPKQAEPTPAAPVEDEPMEVDEDAQAKETAIEEKTKGNAAYKARKFDDAIAHYSKAWDTWPKDVTFLTNLSAVYFEQGEYQQAIDTCQKAVDEGRELRADYKVSAKAYGRIGSSYLKMDDLENAIKFFQKSLTEHRTPDILTKLRESEKAKAEKDKQAYIDPAKADEAREAGNVSFKAGQYADAVKHYTEAVKRLPSDPKALNNRAAAYTKLLAMPEALRDAEAAIKIDPTFIKAYIRKALTQQAMKELTSAIETLQKATDMDKEKKHTRELESNLQNIMMELQQQRSGETDEQIYNRAMRDPEVQEIMADPLMRQILADSQQDPRALMDHMKNPMIAGKIQKLINAGIIKTR